jgi:PadR family transcriptional regulator, regulatory protein AphA
MAKLSTRSYAVLGLLAIRDWTPYELAWQMERGLGDIWSASRSMVFEEPKQLVARGLARATTERTGQRTRTRYGITQEGRAELRDWLAKPGAPPAMQFEGLLKVLLADRSDGSAVLPTLAAARQWAEALRGTGREVASEYATGNGPFQERARLVSVSFAFLWDFADLVARWASWAESEALHWPDGTGGEVFRRALDGQAALPGAASRQPS